MLCKYFIPLINSIAYSLLVNYFHSFYAPILIHTSIHSSIHSFVLVYLFSNQTSPLALLNASYLFAKPAPSSPFASAPIDRPISSSRSPAPSLSLPGPAPSYAWQRRPAARRRRFRCRRPPPGSVPPADVLTQRRVHSRFC